MSESYRAVTALVKSVRIASIIAENPRGKGTISIPRSLIHGGDDIKLDRLCFGTEGITHTFRLLDWKAEEVGLA